MAEEREVGEIWIEMTDKESDWRDSFKICQRAFHNDPFYIFTHPDPEIRKKFLIAYFDYLYPAIFKNGRGVLVVIKLKQKDGEKVIGGMAVTLDQDEELENDVSTLLAVDEEGWRRHERRDDWELATYFGKIKTLADKLGTTLQPGVFMIVDDGYRGKGIGQRFILKGVEMIRDEVIRRKRIAGMKNPKPPLAYCVCDHQRSRNFTKKCGFVEVAEIKTNNAGILNEKTSYIWIFLLPPEDPMWVDLSKREFNYPLSNL